MNPPNRSGAGRDHPPTRRNSLMLSLPPGRPGHRRGKPCSGVRIALALAIALASNTCGCRSSSEAQKVAERFMQLYYGDASAIRAVKLSTGEAEQRLQREIQAIQGLAPASEADRPVVTYTLISRADPNPTTQTYVYTVVPHAAGVGSLTATIDVVHVNDRWLVSSLTETHSPP